MLSRYRSGFLLAPLAVLSLLAALWAGVVRLGWSLPLPAQNFAFHHGPLMIVGFLGTLIGLERAVALERRWPYGASIFSALAVVSLLVGFPSDVARIFSVLASLSLLLIFVSLYRRHPSGSMATMGAGALLWLLGNFLWYSGYTFNQVAPWWVGFLVLTIAGERLELSRLLQLAVWDRLKFFFANGLIVAGLFASLFALSHGVWLAGLGLIGLALWLLRYDIAWRTVRHPGLPRFMAVCLLAGYIWLGFGGALWLAYAEFFSSGPFYDAMLHAVFLGFVFSMIFAHAPVIFPSVTGITMPFLPSFYLHFALLHLSLFLRVWGDLGIWASAQQWGGLLNVVAILVFLANNVHAVIQGRSGISASQA